MEFPYQFERHYRDWFPILPIGLLGEGGRRVETTAYVDSGAVFNIFGSYEAAMLGLRLSEGRRRPVTAGDGRLMHCSVFTLNMQVGSSSFKVDVGFSNDLKIGLNILGLNGFFDRFREVAIRHRARVVVLRP